MNDETRKVLAKPFPFASHKWRVLTVSKTSPKATWYVYVDARDVAERLDETGIDWSDEYEVITMTDKLCVVQCRLTINGSTRTDVGSDSKSSTDSEGNYIKGAYSDALKRAAVKFGVGRYLYGLTSYYLPVDEYKNFTKESETKIKAHLSKELKAVGASGSERDLQGNTEEVEATEVVDSIPAQKTPQKPVQPATEDNGVAGWAKDPERLMFDGSYSFSGPEEAIGWGMAMDVFDHENHARNAYDVVKRDGKPKDAAAMWPLWIADVARRASEKKGQPRVLLAEFEQLGQEIYADQWPQIRRYNVERMSNGKSTSPESMTDEELTKLINGLKKLKRQAGPVESLNEPELAF